jgi:hypothetical protein
MLTGEFRNANHSKYLAEDGPDAEWDPQEELSRSFYIHFSDWPLPKSVSIILLVSITFN